VNRVIGDAQAMQKPSSRKPERGMNNRRRGALIGLAVGGALGAAVELKSPGSFKPNTAYRSSGPRHFCSLFAGLPAKAVENVTGVTREDNRSKGEHP